MGFGDREQRWLASGRTQTPKGPQQPAALQRASPGGEAVRGVVCPLGLRDRAAAQKDNRIPHRRAPRGVAPITSPPAGAALCRTCQHAVTGVCVIENTTTEPQPSPPVSFSNKRTGRSQTGSSGSANVGTMGKNTDHRMREFVLTCATRMSRTS